MTEFAARRRYFLHYVVHHLDSVFSTVGHSSYTHDVDYLRGAADADAAPGAFIET
jgi:hypothetical protein